MSEAKSTGQAPSVRSSVIRQHDASALLEREHQMTLIHHAWRQARAGHGSAWFLCAEAGGGKTRLAAEAVHALGGQAVWGAAEPVSPPDPYLAVARALPEFVPVSTRAGSVANAVAALERVANRSPVIVVFDDLHFADEGTMAVVVRLCSECHTRPWLLLGAYRPGEGPPGLLAPLTELVAQGVARRVDVPPLSRQAVHTLVARVRGQPPVPAEADAIYGGSGGNPWFAEALARGTSAMSATRDRINVRLDYLERVAPGSVRVLEALAPATRPIAHAVLAQLCGGDSRALRDMLKRLSNTGVLRDHDGTWAYRHELLRQALLDGMISADRRDAHRHLAEALAADSSGHDPAREHPGVARPGGAAELAMHFAVAGDARAVAWALQAAREARAVDAHTEALAQLERALAFELAPEQRRSTLQEAALEAYALGRFSDNRRLAEEAIAITGGDPETLSHLHWIAAVATYAQGDMAADEAHLTAAEQLLEGRPVGRNSVRLAIARVTRAAGAVDPERLAATADHALGLVHQLNDPDAAAWVGVSVKRYLAASRIACGDPSGFMLLDELLQDAESYRLAPSMSVGALADAYQAAVTSLFRHEAAGLRARLGTAMQRHELAWTALIEPHHLLELVEQASYDQARELAASIPPAVGATLEAMALAVARILQEARAGTLSRARSMLSSIEPPPAFRHLALFDLARLELATLLPDPDLGELAASIYERMEAKRYARIAGVAAVGLARAGCVAPAAPAWLTPESHLRVLWRWADGITSNDTWALRAVSADLGRIGCAYEAALALRDAGDLREAYQALRAIGATQAREQTAERLRATAQRIPRRSRSALEPGRLTETERQVTRHVATGATNAEIGAALGITARTVETHLTHIYQKVGRQGRVALTTWWAQQSPDTRETTSGQ